MAFRATPVDKKKYGKAYLEYLERFGDDREYFQALASIPQPVASEKPAFVASLYPSGEISAAYFLSGAASKVTPKPRTGPIETIGFHSRSRAKIRRAVENSTTELCCFMTLTFDPSQLQLWHFEDTPDPFFIGPVSIDYPGSTRRTIRHDYAKYKLINFRKALTMKVNRQLAVKEKEMIQSGKSAADIDAYILANKYRFIWTAELHQNGNIHFHLLINKYFAAAYIRQLWGAGRINVKKLADAEHAAHYISKYVSKDDEGTIKGNRYNIAAVLRRESVPRKFTKEDEEAIAMRKLLQLMKETAKENGCIVIDSGFGVSMPRPRRSQLFRDKKGKIKKTRAVNGRFHQSFLDSCWPIPF
jgi:hypothetical protein